MGFQVLLLVLGESLHRSVFINQSSNGFYFYHHQPTTRIKNVLLSNFQGVKLCSVECFTIGLYHLPFRGLQSCGWKYSGQLNKY